MMGNYLDKWKTLFPEVVGGTKRPLEAISDQDEFNTNGFPQFIAQDPVRYDLQNAFMKQFLSNDAWLWVRQQQADQALDRHKDDAQAHPNGVSGNAASTTKLQTARSLNLGGAVTADAATFDGTADTTINVKTLDATKLKGTASVSTTGNAATATKLQTARTLSLTGKAAGSTTFDGSANASINVKFVNADTASKLSTARKINITGNASGSTTFDGTSDVSINVNVSQAAHADKATADKYGADIADNYIKHYINVSTQDLNDVRVGGLYAQSLNANATAERHYPEVNHAGSIFVINNGANGNDGCTQVYTTFDTHNSYKREYDVASKAWSAWRRYAFEDSTVANAQKLATPRAISLTGNASGSANFDGSGNVSINTTVNESKHAATATALDIFAYRPSDANIQKGDGLVRHFLATSGMSKNKPPEGDGHILSFAWDNNGGYDAQLCVNNSTGRINMRGQNAGKWSDWLTVLDSANFNSYAPTKTGAGASGTWGINISGNAASATNADTVDGYHASDLLRILGGNRTPVITDIFDRAGTIDMSTMSAADKATHKANINKASNMTQNIWNNGRDIHAYGGDTNMNGYNHGTLKLTQSYKNFDKLMIVYTDDDGECGEVRMFDVYEFNYCMTNMHSFDIFTDHDRYWTIYGLTKHGNDSGFKPSTETVLSCRDQNSGLIGIYGIKF